MSFLEFQNVSYESDDKPILKNISIRIEQGDFISVIGPSGSGKSTFFKLCGHLISPTAGNITFQNRSFNDYSPTELRKRIGYCFQTPFLFGDTVEDNMNFPFSIRNVKPDRRRISELFSMFHMGEEYLRKDVKILSGGEKQRISLIRSLLFLPEIILLDEITSALDAENEKTVEAVITSLNDQGATILWITHNPQQSRKYANKVLAIEAGEIKSLEVLK